MTYAIRRLGAPIDSQYLFATMVLRDFAKLARSLEQAPLPFDTLFRRGRLIG